MRKKKERNKEKKEMNFDESLISIFQGSDMQERKIYAATHEVAWILGSDVKSKNVRTNGILMTSNTEKKTKPGLSSLLVNSSEASTLFSCVSSTVEAAGGTLWYS